MNYPIIWSPESKTTFEKTIHYLEENWSQKEVSNSIDRVTRLFILFLSIQNYLSISKNIERIDVLLSSR